MSTEKEPLDRWEALPRRIYLDTSVLQTIYDYGEVIFENEEYQPWDEGARNYVGHEDQVLALQRILTVNERGGFEFVLTNANLREAMAHIYSEPGYKQWVFDVLDTWLVQAEDGLPTMMLRPFEKSRNISRKDALLLQDALEYRCDSFLTMETKLKSQGRFVQDVARLRVLRPTDYWELIAPWARLYY